MTRSARRWLAYRRFGILLAHVAIVITSYLGAFFLRFELSIPPWEWALAIQSLPVVVVLRLLFFQRHHLFSGWWQFVGARDVVDILKSTTAGSLAIVFVVTLTGAYPGFPRSIFVLDWLLTLQLLAGSRVVSRLLHSLWHRLRLRNPPSVLIVGTGSMAQSLLRELTVHSYRERPIGFLSEDPAPARGWIGGLPVLGGLRDLPIVLKSESAAEVFIALPADRQEEIHRAIRDCRSAGAAFRIVSSVREYLEQPRLADLSTLEELFDADQPSADDAASRDLLHGKTVLILGAGGQMGAALAREVAIAEPRHLLLFDRNESPLYYLEIEFLKTPHGLTLTPLMGDVLDEDRLRQVFAVHRPEIVIHAAAYTRPELMAANTEESRRNNLQGLSTVARVAAEFGVERLLLLSFDEGRQDSLGCLCRTTELLLKRQARPPGTVFVAARFPSAVGAAGCEITRAAFALQRGLSPVVSDRKAPVRVVTARALAPLLLQALALAEDGDVLAIDAGRPQPLAEVIRYLRHVWNLPEAPVQVVPSAPDHIHSVEVGTPTCHPQVIRRRLGSQFPPCVNALLATISPEAEGGQLVENSCRR